MHLSLPPPLSLHPHCCYFTIIPHCKLDFWHNDFQTQSCSTLKNNHPMLMHNNNFLKSTGYYVDCMTTYLCAFVLIYRSLCVWMCACTRPPPPQPSIQKPNPVISTSGQCIRSPPTQISVTVSNCLRHDSHPRPPQWRHSVLQGLVHILLLLEELLMAVILYSLILKF